MVVSSTQHGENTAFFSGFSLADFMAETLYRLFPPNFKEKASTIFMTQPLKKASSKNFRLLDSGGYIGGPHLQGFLSVTSPPAGVFREEARLRGLLQGAVIGCGCFSSTDWWTYRLFQFSHWRASWLRHCIGYPGGTSKKKALLWYVDVSSPQCDEKDSLFPVFSLTGYTAKAFFRLSLWSFKEKASTIFYNTAKKKVPTISYGTAFNESGITICIVNIV